jgi:NAD(P)-dependent dehydrogenase (short-subunit alcohol dehydrogenase family)
MEEISLRDLQKQFETNFFGVVRVTQHVLPDMRSRRRGRIINMSSVSGLWAVPLFGPYSSSKFALEAISDSWRMELAAFGIQVILIEPGYIPTNMGDRSRELSGAYFANSQNSPYIGIYSRFLNMWKASTAKARSSPDDCAKVILRAITDRSPKARYTVTGRAKFSSISRRFLTDRAKDQMIMKRFGRG